MTVIRPIKLQRPSVPLMSRVTFMSRNIEIQGRLMVVSAIAKVFG
jgi:hypothetical protein